MCPHGRSSKRVVSGIPPLTMATKLGSRYLVTSEVRREEVVRDNSEGLMIVAQPAAIAPIYHVHQSHNTIRVELDAHQRTNCQPQRIIESTNNEHYSLGFLYTKSQIPNTSPHAHRPYLSYNRLHGSSIKNKRYFFRFGPLFDRFVSIHYVLEQLVNFEEI